MGTRLRRHEGKCALSVDKVQVSVLALFSCIGEDGDDALRPVSFFDSDLARQCAGPGQIVDVNRIHLKGRGGSCGELLILNLLQFN